MSDLSSRLAWNLAVYEILNATTRPIGEHQPILDAGEQNELRRCWMNGWSAEAFAEMLQKRDMHLRLVG